MSQYVSRLADFRCSIVFDGALIPRRSHPVSILRSASSRTVFDLGVACREYRRQCVATSAHRYIDVAAALFHLATLRVPARELGSLSRSGFLRVLSGMLISPRN